MKRKRSIQKYASAAIMLFGTSFGAGTRIFPVRLGHPLPRHAGMAGHWQHIIREHGTDHARSGLRPSEGILRRLSALGLP